MCDIIFIQAVYDANKFRKLVYKRNRLQDWLDYYQLKIEKNTGYTDKRPTTKVNVFVHWSWTN